MTFAMYEALFALLRAGRRRRRRARAGAARRGRQGVRGRHRHPQFLAFASGEDGLRYEATIDRIVGRLEAVRKPTVALVDGFAMGSGLALAAACDLRDLHAGGAVRPADRPHARQLPVDGELRAAGALIGEARVKDIVFTARAIGPRRRSRSGSPRRWSTTPRRASVELCERLAGHAPVTMRVTKEALRRLRAGARRRRPRARGLRERGVPSAGTGVPAAMTEAIVCMKRSSPSTSRGRKPVAGPPSRSACSAARISSATRSGVCVCASHGSSGRSTSRNSTSVAADQLGELVERQHARVRGVAQAFEPVLALGDRRVGVASRSATASRPPGRSTRRISPIGTAGSSKWWSAKRETTTSNEPSRNGSAAASACMKTTLRSAARSASIRRARSIAAVASTRDDGAHVRGEARARRDRCRRRRRAPGRRAAARRRSNSHSESVVKRRLNSGSSNAGACSVNAFSTAFECSATPLSLARAHGSGAASTEVEAHGWVGLRTLAPDAEATELGNGVSAQVAEHVEVDAAGALVAVDVALGDPCVRVAEREREDAGGRQREDGAREPAVPLGQPRRRGRARTAPPATGSRRRRPAAGA